MKIRHFLVISVELIELAYGSFFKKSDIDAALEDQDELSPAERISRGDFDA